MPNGLYYSPANYLNVADYASGGLPMNMAAVRQTYYNNRYMTVRKHKNGDKEGNQRFFKEAKARLDKLIEMLQESEKELIDRFKELGLCDPSVTDP